MTSTNYTFKIDFKPNLSIDNYDSCLIHKSFLMCKTITKKIDML